MPSGRRGSRLTHRLVFAVLYSVGSSIQLHVLGSGALLPLWLAPQDRLTTASLHQAAPVASSHAQLGNVMRH